MKKLTALLLGTVISIAFTTNAFADPVALVKSYLFSDDGSQGGYFAVVGHEGTLNEISASYDRTVGNENRGVDQSWDMKDPAGGQLQFGFDFGKIRADMRVGLLKSQVLSINNEKLEFGTSNDAVLGYGTFNLGFDFYRLHLGDLLKAGWPGTPFNIDVALTPYVGAGAGYGGGWMTGKKDSDGVGADTKRDAAGHGFAYSLEAGALINITNWAGITLGYTYLDLSLDNAGFNTDTSADATARSHLASLGIRFTY